MVTKYRLVLTDITMHYHLLHIIGSSITCTLPNRYEIWYSLSTRDTKSLGPLGFKGSRWQPNVAQSLLIEIHQRSINILTCMQLLYSKILNPSKNSYYSSGASDSNGI